MIIEMRKVEIKMNKPIYLGQAILDISKTLMYEFWYDYIKPKYGDKARLCYMDTDSFVMYIKTEEFYKDIASDVKRWFDRSKYDEEDKRPLPIGKNKKVIGKFKDELDGKIMTEFWVLRVKPYAYRLDIDTEEKTFTKILLVTSKDGLIDQNMMKRIKDLIQQVNIKK